jgi:hypothetical protein
MIKVHSSIYFFPIKQTINILLSLRSVGIESCALTDLRDFYRTANSHV